MRKFLLFFYLIVCFSDLGCVSHAPIDNFKKQTSTLKCWPSTSDFSNIKDTNLSKKYKVIYASSDKPNTFLWVSFGNKFKKLKCDDGLIPRRFLFLIPIKYKSIVVYDEEIKNFAIIPLYPNFDVISIALLKNNDDCFQSGNMYYLYIKYNTNLPVLN